MRRSIWRLFVIFLINVSFIQSLVIRDIVFPVEQFKQHRTSQFYYNSVKRTDVIIRRGDKFRFFVELYKPHNGYEVEVQLSFATNNDRMKINLRAHETFNGWKLTQTNIRKRISVEIHIPGNAPVGKWRMEIQLTNENPSMAEGMNVIPSIIVLFNPWSKEDAVYFPDQHKLKEYVLNEKGYTYAYDYKNVKSYPWIFGQFQPDVMESILLVLSRTQLSASQRGDIVQVSRVLSYMLNDDINDTRGVINGRWGDDYPPLDGRPITLPWEWTGSPEIFKQYYKSGGKTLGYGQCFVYGGIFTTALRALGVASRPLTNVLSANSPTRDLTISIHLDENGNIKQQEPVWNFHVWVQAWFSRASDLGDEYSGWQELDATPQERFEGLYQIGPASTKAIRKSNLSKRYENSFVYEAVNADEVFYDSNGNVVSVNHKNIGLQVLTKKFDSEESEDITHMYKPKEGTPEERESYCLAAKSLGIKPPSLNHLNARSSRKAVILNIETSNNPIIGSTISVKVKLRNPSCKERKININLKATSVRYVGQDALVLKTVKTFVILQCLESKYETFIITVLITNITAKNVDFVITPQDYIRKLYDLNTIRIEAALREGKELTFEKQLLSLQAPALQFNVTKPSDSKQQFIVNVIVENPLNQNLSKCEIIYEGTRIPRSVIPIENVSAFSLKKVEFRIKAPCLKKETVVIHFKSNLINQVVGSTELNINCEQMHTFGQYERNHYRLAIESKYGSLDFRSLSETNDDYNSYILKTLYF